MKRLGITCIIIVSVMMASACTDEDAGNNGFGDVCADNADCGEYTPSQKCGDQEKCLPPPDAEPGSYKGIKLYCDCRTYTCLPPPDADGTCWPDPPLLWDGGGAC